VTSLASTQMLVKIIKVLKKKATKENNPKNKENRKYTYAYTHKIVYK